MLKRGDPCVEPMCGAEGYSSTDATPQKHCFKKIQNFDPIRRVDILTFFTGTHEQNEKLENFIDAISRKIYFRQNYDSLVDFQKDFKAAIIEEKEL